MCGREKHNLLGAGDVKGTCEGTWTKEGLFQSVSSHFLFTWGLTWKADSWNFKEEEPAEAGWGTRLGSRAAAQGGGVFRKSLDRWQHLKEEGEWEEVPGFGIWRPWEILESLLTSYG